MLYPSAAGHGNADSATEFGSHPFGVAAVLNWQIGK